MTKKKTDQEAPASAPHAAPKFGYHFPSDGVHFAMFIEASSIQEAEAIYNETRQPMTPQSTAAAEAGGEAGVE